MLDLTADYVQQHLDAARLRLADATGGAALCRIGPDAGEGRLAVKRAEGAAAALADLRDALRRGAASDSALDQVDARWQGDLASHRARASAPEWIAYCQGGIDALGEVATPRGG